jgi:phthiocerol/phenolphthiocerol synthesis type-I polyketide synthase D
MTKSSHISPVFILPGIDGNKSELAEFRSRLSDTLSVKVLDLQSIQEPLAELTDIKAIGRAIACLISQDSPEGFLSLAGYSFGGSVAFEAARHLIESGRTLRFLGIIDVPSPRAEADPVREIWWGRRAIRLIGKIIAGRYGGFSGLAYRAAREVLGRFCSSDSRLRSVLEMVHCFCPSREGSVRRMLLYYFRRRAMRDWRPTPIRGPVFVAISEENSSSIEQWNTLCPQARIVQLPGDHVKIFEPPALEILISEFRDFVQGADFNQPQFSSLAEFHFCSGQEVTPQPRRV